MTGRSRPRRGAAPPSDWTGPGAPGASSCPGCGQLVDPGDRVCRSCGLPVGTPTDPLRGVSTRMLDLPSQRGAGLGAAIGLMAVVLVLGLASALVLTGGGMLSGGGRLIVAENPTSTPGATHAPGSGSPGATDDGTQPAESEGPEPGSTPTTRTGFTCESAGIVDPTSGSWRLNRFSWGEREKWDQLTFSLVREGDSGRATRVSMEWLKPAEAVERYGVTRPVGTRALVVTFRGPAYIRSENLESTDLKAIRSVDVRMGQDVVLRAIIGVRGKGCARLSSPAWTKGEADSAANVLLDVRYE